MIEELGLGRGKRRGVYIYRLVLKSLASESEGQNLRWSGNQTVIGVPYTTFEQTYISYVSVKTLEAMQNKPITVLVPGKIGSYFHFYFGFYSVVKREVRRKWKHWNPTPRLCILRDWWAVSLKHGQKSSQGLLLSDWAEKHKHFLAPVRSQDGRNRLELVW